MIQISGWRVKMVLDFTWIWTIYAITVEMWMCKWNHINHINLMSGLGIENISFLWITMNLNLNKNVEMIEDEIELEHENILFMQPMWKWQTNWIRVMTWTWRLGAALKNLKFTWIKTNMNLSTRHFCNKCGNEWRWHWTFVNVKIITCM